MMTQFALSNVTCKNNDLFKIGVYVKVDQGMGEGGREILKRCNYLYNSPAIVVFQEGIQPVCLFSVQH